MATTAEELFNRVLIKLSEAANSTLGELSSGTGGASTLTFADTVYEFLNEGMSEIGRTCVAIPGSVSTSVAAQTATGPYSQSLHTLTTTPVPTGTKVWAVDAATWASASIKRIDPAMLKTYHRDTWQTTAAGTPLYWYVEAESVLLWPAPSTTGTLKVWGYSTPKPVSAGSDTVDFLPEDGMEPLVCFAAAKVAQSRSENPQLAERVAPLFAQYDKYRFHLWAALPESLRMSHFKSEKFMQMAQAGA